MPEASGGRWESSVGQRWLGRDRWELQDACAHVNRSGQNRRCSRAAQGGETTLGGKHLGRLRVPRRPRLRAELAPRLCRARVQESHRPRPQTDPGEGAPQNSAEGPAGRAPRQIPGKEPPQNSERDADAELTLSEKPGVRDTAGWWLKSGYVCV